MKIRFSVLAVFAAVTFLSPISLILVNEPSTSETVLPAKTQVTLQKADNTRQTILLDDYLQYALSAEMPADSEAEALKAMAVVLRTYAMKCMQQDGYIPCDTYVQNSKAIYTDAVAKTSGLVLTYENDLIIPAFHAISSGRSENASDVWGQDIPYLISVNCAFDMLNSGYMTDMSVTAEQVKNALNGLNVSFSDDYTTWFSDWQTGDTGRVTAVSVCGTIVSGQQLCDLLRLKSACFRAEAQENGFLFQCMGVGHGVGLSKNGANYLASQGKSAEEILSYFYTGVTVQKDFEIVLDK